MDRNKLRLILAIALIAIVGAYVATQFGSHQIVLTGLVTTNEVVVSSQISGQVGRLLVHEGDTVMRDQQLAEIKPDELRAESSYYALSAEGLASRVKEAEAALRLQEKQTADQIQQAEATLAATEAQRTAAGADVENARLLFERNEQLVKQGIVAQGQYDDTRTKYDASKARLDALRRQAEAEQAAVALARANAEQIAMRRHELEANQQQQQAAAAQRAKADVRLAYTEIRAPIEGIIDVRAVREGEVVAPGQPMLTIVNPDDLWVRADVEESYIDRMRVGDTFTVRLPSGAEMPGKVFYRGVDAGFATQRDVSRTKRDIKTFEVRLRVDNSERHLAVGMTAYVLLPLS